MTVDSVFLIFLNGSNIITLFITTPAPNHTRYPKTSPGLKGAFSRLLEAGSGGPALGQ